jgi:hypothetical protein
LAEQRKEEAERRKAQQEEVRRVQARQVQLEEAARHKAQREEARRVQARRVQLEEAARFVAERKAQREEKAERQREEQAEREEGTSYHWTDVELSLFEQGVIAYGWGNWATMARLNIVPTRDRAQLCAHANIFRRCHPADYQRLIGNPALG